MVAARHGDQERGVENRQHPHDGLGHRSGLQGAHDQRGQAEQLKGPARGQNGTEGAGGSGGDAGDHQNQQRELLVTHEGIENPRGITPAEPGQHGAGDKLFLPDFMPAGTGVGPSIQEDGDAAPGDQQAHERQPQPRLGIVMRFRHDPSQTAGGEEGRSHARRQIIVALTHQLGLGAQGAGGCRDGWSQIHAGSVMRQAALGKALSSLDLGR